VFTTSGEAAEIWAKGLNALYLIVTREMCVKMVTKIRSKPLTPEELFF